MTRKQLDKKVFRYQAKQFLMCLPVGITGMYALFIGICRHSELKVLLICFGYALLSLGFCECVMEHYERKIAAIKERCHAKKEYGYGHRQ